MKGYRITLAQDDPRIGFFENAAFKKKEISPAEMPNPESAKLEEPPEGRMEFTGLLKDIPDFPKASLKILADAGIKTIAQVLELDEFGLLGIDGIGNSKAREIMEFCQPEEPPEGE